MTRAEELLNKFMEQQTYTSTWFGEDVFSQSELKTLLKATNVEELQKIFVEMGWGILKDVEEKFGDDDSVVTPSGILFLGNKTEIRLVVAFDLDEPDDMFVEINGPTWEEVSNDKSDWLPMRVTDS